MAAGLNVTQRRRYQQRPVLSLAVGLSVGLHATAMGLLALAVQQATEGRTTISLRGDLTALAGLEASTAGPTYIELLPADLVDPTLAGPVPLPDAKRQAMEADQTTRALHPSIISRGNSPLREAPAPDQGVGAGREVPPAFRRDASTLRARVRDSAAAYQPAHDRTARLAASPQAARQEPVVGSGDAVRTRRPRPSEPQPPLPASPLTSDDPSPDRIVVSDGLLVQETGRDRSRGEGPLDTDEGRRSYDVEAEGKSADNVALRAASNEAHPGRADFTAAAAAGPKDSATGQGPAVKPGAVAQPSGATSASRPGVPIPADRGTQNELDTVERVYSREYQEIQRRVNRTLVFPKRLLLDLQQGETFVFFEVDNGGRVVGDVKLLKSAGFPEFDLEAVAAVRRAAPFPRMNRPLRVRLRLTFDNPVIR